MQALENIFKKNLFMGDRLAAKIPMKLVHGLAAAVFAALGVATLLGAGAGWGF